MSTVILAEKPSQALAYASAFQKSEKKQGFFAVSDPLFKDETFVTFGFGHLVELVAPRFYDEKWDKWAIDTLPIFPSEFKFEVSKDKKTQFSIVSKLLKEAKTIIIATDSDREGENIAWSIIEKANAFTDSKDFKRLWINSLEREAIREGFSNLKNGLDYLPYYKEAQTRQFSDWLIGMNGSPLYSLSLQSKGINEKFSLGRVQTPTLYMIYSRQLEIETFKKTKYVEVESNISSGTEGFKAVMKPKQRFDNEQKGLEFLKDQELVPGNQEGVIKKLEVQEKKTNSPLLFSLSSLQSQANKQFKASASETLKAVQGLYEAKLLTYPRTDTAVVTENEFKYLREHLSEYKQFLSIDVVETQTEARKRYVDNEKVQEHHAIIPTKRVVDQTIFEKLSPLQQNIYTLILKTTIAMFLSDYRYEETTIDTAVKNVIFTAKGKVPLDQGWKQIFSDTEEKETVLPKVKENDQVSVEILFVEKETQPPKAYTEGTLITAMKTAGKTVDDVDSQKLLNEIEGIGTEATRASIIETLKNKEYIVTQKNNLVVTEKGKILCEAVSSERLLTSAEMTAEWETYLKKIGKGEGNQEQFISNIKKFIVHLLDNVPSAIDQLNISGYQAAATAEKEKNAVGNCPNCGSLVLEKKGFYGCSGYPKCTFSVNNVFRSKKLTKTNIKQLLSDKETTIKGIKKKDSSSTYDAIVGMNQKGFLEFKGFAGTKKKTKK
jgi:DNA topoisomerase-3